MGGTSNEVIAKEALCFMIVSVMEGWRIPFGYFLIAGLNGTGKKGIFWLYLIPFYSDIGFPVEQNCCFPRNLRTSEFSVAISFHLSFRRITTFSPIIRVVIGISI